MASRGDQSKASLGFLTVIQDSDYGLLGGYLILNTAGRPEEFHCTAPVRPSRAQQILYGPTLEPYLYGEQIGRTLAARSKAQPLVLCTDRGPALAVREHVDMPVALVLPGDGEAGDGATASCESHWRLDKAHGRQPPLVAFRLGKNQLAVPATMSCDREAILQRLAELAECMDLAEPFGRIREAIEEARRGGQ
ncbi:MAG: hypothetical protein HUU20_23845 [Pirellulales bacterium]|nr:hypothetical protein [Pirellulales bacterium]